MDSIVWLAAAAFLLFVVAVVAATAVLVVALGKPRPRSYESAHRPTFSTPLERVKAVASELTAAEWEEFRRWVAGRKPLPPTHGEGVTR